MTDPEATSLRSSVGGREKSIAAMADEIKDSERSATISHSTSKKSRSRLTINTNASSSSSRGSPATSPPATLPSKVDQDQLTAAVTERKTTQRLMDRLVRQESKNLVLSLDLEMDRPIGTSKLANSAKPDIPASTSAGLNRDKKRFGSPARTHARAPSMGTALASSTREHVEHTDQDFKFLREELRLANEKIAKLSKDVEKYRKRAKALKKELRTRGNSSTDASPAGSHIVSESGSSLSFVSPPSRGTTPTPGTERRNTRTQLLAVPAAENSRASKSSAQSDSDSDDHSAVDSPKPHIHTVASQPVAKRGSVPEAELHAINKAASTTLAESTKHPLSISETAAVRQGLISNSTKRTAANDPPEPAPMTSSRSNDALTESALVSPRQIGTSGSALKRKPAAINASPSESQSGILSKIRRNMGLDKEKRSERSIDKEAVGRFLERRNSTYTAEAWQKGSLKQPLFGIPLDYVLAGAAVPAFVQEIVTLLTAQEIKGGLKELLAPPKDNVAVKELRNQLEEGKKLSELTPSAPILLQALRMFLRDLPEPLVPFNFFDKFLVVQEISTSTEQSYLLTNLHLLYHQLPAINRGMLQFLIKFFLQLVQKYPEGTALAAHERVAREFAPLILRIDDDLERLATERCNVLVLLMLHFSAIQDPPQIMYTVADVEAGAPSQLKAAAIEKLLEKLVAIHDSEKDFAKIFLLMHTYFISHQEVINALQKYYQPELMPEELMPWQKLRRIRIVEVLDTWLNHAPPKNPDDTLLNSIGALVKSINSTRMVNSFNRYKEGMAKTLASNTLRRQLSAAAAKSALVVSLSAHSPQEIAEQLALIDHDALCGINLQEFFHKAFVKPETSPSFHSMVDSFNKKSLWVASEIVRRQAIQERAEMLTLFLDVCSVSWKLRDFNAAFSIYCGLNMAPVLRLKQTWEKVPKKSFTRYQKLLPSFESSSGHKNYRDTLMAEDDEPTVPYVGLYAKFAFAIEENNALRMPSSNLINFEKLRMLWKVIDEIKHFQDTPYDIPANQTLQEYLRNPPILSEDDIYIESVLREQRKPGPK